MKDYYVTLTGAMNNAGDFLIRKRALALLARFRPDREVVDLPRWEKLDSTRVALINGAKALLLTGGPAVQRSMYPGIYPLTDNLDDITTPISLYGVGWKSGDLDSGAAAKYVFTASSRVLLRKIAASSLISSVRDYDTLRILGGEGFGKIMMTGCPAFHRTPDDPQIREIGTINSIGFSLGVGFVRNPDLEAQTKKLIEALRRRFGAESVVVTLQHSVKPENFPNRGSQMEQFIKRHCEFLAWLRAEGISVVDLSGNAEKMTEFYASCDAHVGYRVHSHICALSLGLPSYLVCEDSRGWSLTSFLGAGGYRALEEVSEEPEFILARLKRRKARHVAPDISERIIDDMDYETATFPSVRSHARAILEVYLSAQRRYLESLP